MRDNESSGPVREAVDELFATIGPLIAAQICDENAKLADLFRDNGESGVALYGRPFAKQAFEQFVERLTGEHCPPLWFSILLTGKLNSLTHVSRRFMYWDYKTADKGLKPSASLWGTLIDNRHELEAHFSKKLSLSKLYESGLLEPSVRHVHLLNLDGKKKGFSLGAVDPRTTAVGLWGREAFEVSGMRHGLEDERKEKFREYLKFLFVDTGICLYTACPIVSEHNVLNRSIGEVFLAEGDRLLSAEQRGALLSGLKCIAHGLAARCFFIDQEELERERLRLRRFEERMTMIAAPLQSLTNAIDQVRANTQRINMAVYAPADGLFKMHREVGRFFTQQTLQVAQGVAVQVAHRPDTYGRDQALPVLALILAELLGFKDVLDNCRRAEDLVNVSRRMLLAISEVPSDTQTLLIFIHKHITRIGGKPEDLLKIENERVINVLDNLKAVLHTPFKPAAEEWPILALAIACQGYDHGEGVKVTKVVHSSTGWQRISGLDNVLEDESKIAGIAKDLQPPYALNDVLEFIVRLRNGQAGSGGGSPIKGLTVYDGCSMPSKFLCMEIAFDLRDGSTGDYAAGIARDIGFRLEGRRIGRSGDMAGDAVWPFLHLLEIAETWMQFGCKGTLDAGHRVQEKVINDEAEKIYKHLKLNLSSFLRVFSSLAKTGGRFVVCDCGAESDNRTVVRLLIGKCCEQGPVAPGARLATASEPAKDAVQAIVRPCAISEAAQCPVYLVDHRGLNGCWSRPLNAAGFKVLDIPARDLGRESKILFCHGSHDERIKAMKWLQAGEARNVILVGSGDPPDSRSLPHAERSENVTWGFCPWSFSQFEQAKSPYIKTFIQSVFAGTPRYDLFKIRGLPCLSGMRDALSNYLSAKKEDVEFFLDGIRAQLHLREAIIIEWEAAIDVSSSKVIVELDDAMRSSGQIKDKSNQVLAHINLIPRKWL